jgi:cell division protein FtsI (penicillin-binding protein 3)
MGMKVKLVGEGKVRKQSVDKGVKLKKKQTIVLELS